eukprot:850864-Pelagomonas_calceolata.AAC.3
MRDCSFTGWVEWSCRVVQTSTNKIILVLAATFIAVPSVLASHSIPGTQPVFQELQESQALQELEVLRACMLCAQSWTQLPGAVCFTLAPREGGLHLAPTALKMYLHTLCLCTYMIRLRCMVSHGSDQVVDAESGSCSHRGSCAPQHKAAKMVPTSTTRVLVWQTSSAFACPARSWRSSRAPKRKAATMMPVSTPKVLVRPPGERQMEWVDLWEAYVSAQ